MQFNFKKKTLKLYFTVSPAGGLADVGAMPPEEARLALTTGFFRFKV